MVSGGEFAATTTKFEDRVDAIDPVGIFMKAIVAALVSDIIDNQDAAGHTDCETGDINE
jgi:hypothetical protein